MIRYSPYDKYHTMSYMCIHGTFIFHSIAQHLIQIDEAVSFLMKNKDVCDVEVYNILISACASSVSFSFTHFNHSDNEPTIFVSSCTMYCFVIVYVKSFSLYNCMYFRKPIRSQRKLKDYGSVCIHVK